MDDYIDEYAKKKSITSKHSLTTMKSNLRRVEKLIGKKIETWKESDFKDDSKIFDNLVEKYQPNSIIVTLNAIKVWLLINKSSAKIIDEYGKLIKELGQEKDNETNRQKKTAAEEDLGDDFDFEKLRSKVKSYVTEHLPEANTESKLRQLLLVSLFSLQIPTRIGNYLGMEMRKGEGSKLENNKNYLMKTKTGWKFIFNKFKTSKYLGKVELRVEDKLLQDVLEKYISKIPRKQDVLFDATQSQITNNLNSITKKIFNVPFSVNLFRHSFSSWFLSTNPSIVEKEKTAKILGQVYAPSRMEKYARREEKGDDEA